MRCGKIHACAGRKVRDVATRTNALWQRGIVRITVDTGYVATRTNALWQRNRSCIHSPKSESQPARMRCGKDYDYDVGFSTE